MATKRKRKATRRKQMTARVSKNFRKALARVQRTPANDPNYTRYVNALKRVTPGYER